jgi:hypothetical protein
MSLKQIQAELVWLEGGVEVFDCWLSGLRVFRFLVVAQKLPYKCASMFPLKGVCLWWEKSGVGVFGLQDSRVKIDSQIILYIPVPKPISEKMYGLKEESSSCIN